jgi:hypothetical protein
MILPARAMVAYATSFCINYVQSGPWEDLRV